MTYRLHHILPTYVTMNPSSTPLPINGPTAPHANGFTSSPANSITPRRANGLSPSPVNGSTVLPANGSTYPPANADPMASTNPYATSTSQRGYAAPKKKRNKWIWIGLPILAIIIIGAVLGGVLGTQLNKHSSTKTSSASTNGGSANGAVGNTGLPSGVTGNSAAATSTGANGEVYLAEATDNYMLPVYATGVSPNENLSV